jgi:hypothetical protein
MQGDLAAHLTPAKAFAAVLAIWTVGMVLAGMATFDVHSAPANYAAAMLDALAGPKAVSYYFNPAILSKLGPSLTIVAQTDTSAITRCYSIEDGLHPMLLCAPGPTITLDRHAVGTLLSASMNAKGALLSEFVTGHIRIEGLDMLGLLGVLK